MKTKRYRFLFRFPRIFAIVFILFISMFALDVFGNGYSLRQTVVGLFMHLIPTWILLIVLLLSRRRYPLIGAIVFTGFAVRYTTINVINFLRATPFESMPPYYYLIQSIIIALPALAVGVMFFCYRRLNKKGIIAK